MGQLRTSMQGNNKHVSSALRGIQVITQTKNAPIVSKTVMRGDLSNKTKLIAIHVEDAHQD